MTLFLLCAAAYLMGAVPTGYIVTKLVKGIDIRTVGSGNPGATNVYRTVGAAAGAATFFLDVVKGFLPVFMAVTLLPEAHPAFWVITGICAVAGHMWTIFLGFKGGKGVATSCGVFLALMPLPTLFAFILFLAVLRLTRYVSAGSICAAVSLPLFSLLKGESITLSAFAALLGALVVYKHKTNISRILKGTEHKFGAKTND